MMAGNLFLVPMSCLCRWWEGWSDRWLIIKREKMKFNDSQERANNKLKMPSVSKTRLDWLIHSFNDTVTHCYLLQPTFLHSLSLLLIQGQIIHLSLMHNFTEENKLSLSNSLASISLFMSLTTHTHTHTHTLTHTHKHIHTRTYTHTHTHWYTHTSRTPQACKAT